MLHRLTFLGTFLVVILSACTPAEAQFDLVFPSVETFLFADQVTITVYETSDPDELCTAFSIGLPVNDDVVARVEAQKICDVQQGSVSLQELMPDTLVFTASVFDVIGEEILHGCAYVAVAEENVSDDGLLVDIALALTSKYPEPEHLLPACYDGQVAQVQKCEEALVCDERASN